MLTGILLKHEKGFNDRALQVHPFKREEIEQKKNTNECDQLRPIFHDYS